jgi:hypothetical protein
MNRQDLMSSALRSAHKSAEEVDRKYTCPSCKNKLLYDPDTKVCGNCGLAQASYPDVEQKKNFLRLWIKATGVLALISACFLASVGIAWLAIERPWIGVPLAFLAITAIIAAMDSREQRWG